MFDRLRSSWSLVKASWNVLLADKELIIFPVVSMFGAIIVTISFFVPTFMLGVFNGVMAGEQQSKIAAGILGFIFYVVLYTVIFYCNTALVGAALIRLRGGDPTLKDGFSIASQHLGSIIGYAVISATVGMLLRWLRDKGILGRLASGLFGLAWNIATYLVVPILVTEKLSPFQAIKRSTALLKKTWGEQLIGGVSIGLIFGLFVFGVILAGVPVLIATAALKSMLLIGMVVAIWTLVIIGAGLVSSALTGIYTAAVYQYATNGTPSPYFSESQITSAFRMK